VNAPKQISVSYLSYNGASPAVVTVATQVIPVSTEFDTLLSGITKRGGVVFDSSGVPTFVPLSQIVKIAGV